MKITYSVLELRIPEQSRLCWCNRLFHNPESNERQDLVHEMESTKVRRRNFP